METDTITACMGALGLKKKGLTKFFDRIPDNIKIHKIQKITLLEQHTYYRGYYS